MDNGDCHTQANQLRIFDYLNVILNEVPRMFGFGALREYSLNELGQIKGKGAFYELRTLHMTTPSLRGMLKLRFDYVASLLDQEEPPETTVPCRWAAFLDPDD